MRSGRLVMTVAASTSTGLEPEWRSPREFWSSEVECVHPECSDFRASRWRKEMLRGLRRLIRPAREWLHGNCGDLSPIRLPSLSCTSFPSSCRPSCSRSSPGKRSAATSVGRSLARELVAHALGDRSGAPSPSCADLAGNLIGAVHSGRSDSATNSPLLEEAVVQDSHGAAAA